MITIISSKDDLLALPGSKFAFFAGSFNPIHDGHVAVAEEALRRFVDTVVFCAHSHNQQKELIPIYHRFEIIKKLLQSSNFKNRISLFDPCFCHGIENEQFIEIAEFLINSKRKVFILKGQDALAETEDYALRGFDHIIHNRGGSERCLHGIIAGKVIRFDSVSAMSSTEVRRNLAAGLKVHSCKQTNDYILENELYHSMACCLCRRNKTK